MAQAKPALITVMTRAVEVASKMLRRDFYELENLQVSSKSPSNFVTAADKKSEDLIRRELYKARPSFGFIMEEGGTIIGEDTDRFFIIDPIDGTKNFIHAIPHWAIAIAVQEHGQITAAVTYDVCKDELFWAVRGGGAFLNERRLRVSGRKQLEDSIAASGSPAKGRGDMTAYKRDLDAVLPEVSGFRRLGAASLELAYIAAGRLDIYWENGLNIWDIAGGILMVEESGGKVTAHDGKSSALNADSMLATNGSLHADMVRLLSA